MCKTLRAAQYIRMSTDKQDESPQQQRDEIRDQILTREPYKLIDDCEYGDEGIGGDSDQARPGFMRLLRDAEAGKFDVILCYDQDRFSRQDMADSGGVISRLKYAGVKLHTVANGCYDFKDQNDQARYQLVQMGKHQFCKDQSRNIKRAQKNMLAAKKFTGSTPAFGYQRDSNGRLVFASALLVKTVREMFKRKSQGQSTTRIAAWLNNQGIRSPRGKNWSVQGVLHILKNPVYRGHTVTGRVVGSKYQSEEVAKHMHEAGVKKYMKRNPQQAWNVTENTHDPMIDAKTFERVQEMIAHANKRGTGPKSKNRYAFSSLLKCSYCGGSMSGCYNRVSKTRTAGKRYYQCIGECSERRVAYEVDLIPAITGAVAEFFTTYLTPAKMTRLENEIARQLKSEAGNTRRERLEMDYANLTGAIENAMVNYLAIPASNKPMRELAFKEIETDQARHAELAAQLESLKRPADSQLGSITQRVDEAMSWTAELSTLGKSITTDKQRVDFCRLAGEFIDWVKVDVQAIKPAGCKNRFRLASVEIFLKARDLPAEMIADSFCRNLTDWESLTVRTTTNENGLPVHLILGFAVSA